jgi:hypothetical protein
MEVNKQLDKMGYNIGLRLIEDFLAKTNTGRCANFRETAETISKVRIPLNPDCVTAGYYIPRARSIPAGRDRTDYLRAKGGWLSAHDSLSKHG